MPKKNISVPKNPTTLDFHIAGGTVYTENIATAKDQMNKIFQHMKEHFPQYSEYLVLRDYPENTTISDLRSRAGLNDNTFHEMNIMPEAYDDEKYGDMAVRNDVDVFPSILNIPEEKKAEFLDNIYKNGDAKAFIKEYASLVTDNKIHEVELINNQFPNSSIDISSLNIASKIIADELGHPEFFPEVEEVTYYKGGEEKKGYYVHDVEGKAFTSTEDVADIVESKEKDVPPKRKLMNATPESKRILSDLATFGSILGEADISSENYRFEVNPDGSVKSAKMTGNNLRGSFYKFDKDMYSSGLAFISEDMANRVSEINTEKLAEKLTSNGIDSQITARLVGNIESLKKAIEEGKEYHKGKEEDADGKHLKVLSNEDFGKIKKSEMDILSSENNILGAVSSDTFYQKGATRVHNNPVSEVSAKEVNSKNIATSLTDTEEFKNVCSDIKNNKRKFLFFTLSNSPEYNAVLEAMEKYQKAPKDNNISELSKLQEACEKYTSTRNDPNNKRHQNVKALLERTKDIMDKHEEIWLSEGDNEKKANFYAKMTTLSMDKDFGAKNYEESMSYRSALLNAKQFCSINDKEQKAAVLNSFAKVVEESYENPDRFTEAERKEMIDMWKEESFKVEGANPIRNKVEKFRDELTSYITENYKGEEQKNYLKKLDNFTSTRIDETPSLFGAYDSLNYEDDVRLMAVSKVLTSNILLDSIERGEEGKRTIEQVLDNPEGFVAAVATSEAAKSYDTGEKAQELLYQSNSTVLNNVSKIGSSFKREMGYASIASVGMTKQKEIEDARLEKEAQRERDERIRQEEEAKAKQEEEKRIQDMNNAALKFAKKNFGPEHPVTRELTNFAKVTKEAGNEKPVKIQKSETGMKKDGAEKDGLGIK